MWTSVSRRLGAQTHFEISDLVADFAQEGTKLQNNGLALRTD